MFLHIAYPVVLYTLGVALALISCFKFFLMKRSWYTYPLTDSIIKHALQKPRRIKYFLFLLRFCTLCFLVFLASRPQWADERSRVNVDGIDIVIALDISGSMQLFDDQHDRRMRVDVAKAEAIRFIEKRTNDPIGLVLFAKDAISRCPLTLDKHILKELVGNIEIGLLDPDGTALGTGLATAVNRLKDSKAKSKIIILLTDGEPSPEKIAPETAIELAQQNHIKVYTIGIGNDQGGFIMHPMFGLQAGQTRVNVPLLKTIAEKTGGEFFLAHNPKEMRTVYEKIDKLEKTEIQTDIFHTFYEAFAYFIWLFLALFFFELLLRISIWRGLA
ncbi:VWA domain-containing protein [Candidatus Dependentiae bacterium]|nr:VWA domain-containing protein [Candidatus Dependentiae bacterium]